MKKIEDDPYNLYKKMTNTVLIAVAALFLLSIMVTSCSVVEGIFKAGMGVGIFAILAVMVVIVFIVSRIRKK